MSTKSGSLRHGAAHSRIVDHDREHSAFDNSESKGDATIGSTSAATTFDGNSDLYRFLQQEVPTPLRSAQETQSESAKSQRHNNEKTERSYGSIVTNNGNSNEKNVNIKKISKSSTASQSQRESINLDPSAILKNFKNTEDDDDEDDDDESDDADNSQKNNDDDGSSVVIKRRKESKKDESSSSSSDDESNTYLSAKRNQQTNNDNNNDVNDVREAPVMLMSQVRKSTASNKSNSAVSVGKTKKYNVENSEIYQEQQKYRNHDDNTLGTQSMQQNKNEEEGKQYYFSVLASLCRCTTYLTNVSFFILPYIL
jgi:hypothetical protein